MVPLNMGYKPGFQYVDFPIPKDIPTVAVSSSSVRWSCSMAFPTIQWTVQMSNLAMSIMLVIFGEIREWKGTFHAHQFLNGSGKVINESVDLWFSEIDRLLLLSTRGSRMSFIGANSKVKREFSCGGVLISPNKILTAANCVDGRSLSDLKIGYGSLDRDSEPTTSHLSEITIHPDYDPLTLSANIAVLTLRDVFSAPSYAPLAQQPSIRTGDSLTLYGWGRTSLEKIKLPTKLHKVEVQALDTIACVSEHLDLGSGQFCDTSTSGKGSCFGDHGGPALDSSGTVVGIISGRQNCGLAKSELITDVAYYYTWIISH
ncbi:trypsin-like cysteine/serine peptidase domain-containing protein [Aspergillus flavus]|uniref:Trypsin-like cysteine/serine peptidase domain-containing protein n=1 Tax=Aspergillus flavus TaxID=5059 RepID=A0A5N6H0D9_ASPFL|nr:trypsin-like cysteine/serine peptidase domain-containing protein [Aspergillus flavus]